jgi:hypothetical protein
MWRSSVPNFTKLGQQIWKERLKVSLLALPDDCLYNEFIENMSKILVASIGHGRNGGQPTRRDEVAFRDDF